MPFFATRQIGGRSKKKKPGYSGGGSFASKKGSGSNPVQRMGLGSIYDKIKLNDNRTSIPRSTGAPRVSSGGGGGRSYARGGGGGGRAYSGPSAAEIAAAQAAAAAAFRKQVMDMYVGPSDRLYQTAIDAADSDKIRARQGFDQAAAGVHSYVGQVRVAEGSRQHDRNKAYGAAARAMGINDQQGLRAALVTDSIQDGTRKVVRRNRAFNQAKDSSLREMYQTQKDNAVGRVTGYQDELRRQQQLARKQIAAQYGITI